MFRRLDAIFTLSDCQAPVEYEPEFLEALENHTVTQGRDVIFTCVVNHLGPYKSYMQKHLEDVSNMGSETSVQIEARCVSQEVLVNCGEISSQMSRRSAGNEVTRNVNFLDVLTESKSRKSHPIFTPRFSPPDSICTPQIEGAG
ncbi:hypothetical protein AAG570_001833 [Ranatra chinensis]|uniref:Uncharacterized protein n=1 Tax=Ranatra chinensis TaxID=642074 RepID=A0ABD0YS84_9HEMI